MKEDSGVKELYSRTSIFERIYQQCTTREHTAFTLNYYHTTTSDRQQTTRENAKTLHPSYFWIKEPGYMLGGCNRKSFYLFAQLRFKTLQLSVPNSKRLEGYTQTGIFKQHKDSRPSNFLFQIARGSGATLSECTFSLKKHTSPKGLLQDRPLQDLMTKRTWTKPYPSSFW